MAFLAESGTFKYLFMANYAGSENRVKDWIYITTDTITTVSAASYFTLDTTQYVSAGDSIRVIKTTDRNDLTQYQDEWEMIVTSKTATVLTVALTGDAGYDTDGDGLVDVTAGGTGVGTLTGIVKGNGTSAFTAAIEGTDYYAPAGTDVAIADGGTGGSTALAGRNNLGIYAINPIADHGAVGDGATDDAIPLQAAIDAAEVRLAAGDYNVVIDLGGKTYGTTAELIHDSGIGLKITNGAIKALASAVWATSPYTAADVPDFIRTNDALHRRDLTDAVWVKSNVTVARDAIGIDGLSNTASTLTATAGNGTVKQTLPSSSDEYVLSAFVKQTVGTGDIDMTLDNGGTWTTLSAPLLALGEWRQFKIPPITFSAATPIIGFRIATNTDAIVVDFVQAEVISATDIPIVMPPITAAYSSGADDNSAAVTNVLPSTYLIRLVAGASAPVVTGVYLDCNNLCGGIYVNSPLSIVEFNRIEQVWGIGIKQEAGDAKISFNEITGHQSIHYRNSIGIFSAQADASFTGNVPRYHTYPIYFGPSEETAEWGSTGIWTANHPYNGHATYNPLSCLIYHGTGSSTNVMNGTYLDNGYIILRSFSCSYWNSRCGWGNVNCDSLFAFWTDQVGDTLNTFEFANMEYSASKFVTAEAALFSYNTFGSGTWAGINETAVALVDGGGMFKTQIPAIVSDGGTIARFIGNAANSVIKLYGLTTANAPEISVQVDDITLRTTDLERLRISSAGVITLSNSAYFNTLELGAATDTTLTRTSAGDMSIEGNIVYRAGGTDVPVADGGTGASTAAAARTNLGLPSRVLVAATQNKTDSTLTASVLTLTLAANTTYRLEFEVFFVTTGTASGFKWEIDGPATPTYVSSLTQYVSPGALTTQNTVVANGVPAAVDLAAALAIGRGWVKISMLWENGANAGACRFRFAQSTTDASAVSVLKGSRLTYETLA